MLKMLNAVALAIALPAVANAQSTPATKSTGQSDMCAMHSKMAAMDHSNMPGMDMSKTDHSKMAGMDMAKVDHSKMMASCHVPAATGSDSAHHAHDAH